ncbi:MAG: DUF2452 domain-containing protein [Chitinophagaceae bacterium]|nr:DUF2452 domain-containing protein [Chitinophagaceae bacterium]
MIYGAKLTFKPNISQIYYLYEKNDESLMLSLVSPKEWGPCPIQEIYSMREITSEHTWTEI